MESGEIDDGPAFPLPNSTTEFGENIPSLESNPGSLSLKMGSIESFGY